jgi:hypothetical protein
VTMIAPYDDDALNSVGVRGDPTSQSERDLRAWQRTIRHLDERGLTPLGVPIHVVMELYAIGDDDLLRVLDTLWDAA